MIDTISAEIIIISMLLDALLTNETHLAMFVIRLLAFPALEVVAVIKLREVYFEVQSSLKKGWGSFSLVSILFYALLLATAVYPSLITERPEDIPAMILLLILMPLMYLNIFQLFARQSRIHAMERESEVLRLQTAHLENRMYQNAETAELVRIARHDLRHRLMTIDVMLEKGEYTQASEYISAAVGHLEMTSVERVCVNPILDTVFSSFFGQAKAKGIKIETSLAIPNELPVDATELSIVLANALENAIHACEKLPEDQRVIKCRCVNRPQIMLQISNPFVGEVKFDAEGNPLSEEKGHGIGTRSILSFCERNNAYVDYKVKDNWFYLRIVLPE